MVEAAPAAGRRSSASRAFRSRVEDAASLTLADASVDGVLCRWGLMLVPDMDAAAREIVRVVRPGGRAALAVWADPDANDWMTATGRAALELGLMERPDPDAPGPFRLSAPGRLAAVLEAAGLRVETVQDVRTHLARGDARTSGGAPSGTCRMTLGALLAALDDEQIAALRAGAERRVADVRGRGRGGGGPRPRPGRTGRPTALTGRDAKWRGPESNRRHHGFQPCALPTELPRLE